MTDRFYKNSDGIFVPSGTTVLPKPYLAKWAANCAVDYIENCETVLLKEVPARSGPPFREWGLKDDDLSSARTAFERESTEAAEYGTYIHTLCRHSLENDIKIESPHEMTQKFMDGLWKWKIKHKIKVIVMEHEVVTDTYGGRLDMVCETDGVVTLVDFKTGKGQYYKETWCPQLAGYRQIWNMYYCVLGKDCEKHDFPICPCQRLEPNCKKIIQAHGILKFNKETMKVNYKDFTSYQATRTIKTGPRLPDGKLPTEKYTRTYEDDRNTFNALVSLCWIINRGGL